jgi:hypothetical protein
LRVIQTAETLEEARIQLARMLNVFDKLEAQGIKGDAAVAEAEERLLIAVTGYGRPDDRRRSRAVGIDHHLLEPGEPEVLLTLLSRSAAVSGATADSPDGDGGEASS